MVRCGYCGAKRGESQRGKSGERVKTASYAEVLALPCSLVANNYRAPINTLTHAVRLLRE